MADDTSPSKVEQFNNLVRGLVTLGLTAGFIAGFLWVKVIGGDVYANMFGIIVTFWFSQRQAERAAAAIVAAQQKSTTAPNGTPPPAPAPAVDTAKAP